MFAIRFHGYEPESSQREIVRPYLALIARAADRAMDAPG